MREIEFRTWHDCIKKMHSWDDLRDGTGLHGLLSNGFDGVHVVMQYTGLTDRNGNKIFEGDLIKFHFEFEGPPLPPDERTEITIEEHIMVVLFENGVFCVNGECQFSGLDVFQALEYGKGQVIGNIYENPELLNAN